MGKGRPWLASLIVIAAAAPARAQSDAPVGVRAAGMGGAFTAVADDASATFWNPAGLASGSYFSVMADGNVLDRRSALFVGLGTPPVGILYYREKLAPNSAAPSGNGRNGVIAHQAGVSLVQSIAGSHLAVGSTLKVVHAAGANRFDADVGVMAAGSLGRIGLTVHHVAEPEFGEPGATLERRVRAGMAILVRRDTTVAADVDLTRTSTPLGPWRDAAIGVETQPRSRAWLRSGVHWNTGAGNGAEAPVMSIGGSYAVYGSVLADAQWSFGSASGDRGWGIGLRFNF